jgi:hypothetical protein
MGSVATHTGGGLPPALPDSRQPSSSSLPRQVRKHEYYSKAVLRQMSLRLMAMVSSALSAVVGGPGPELPEAAPRPRGELERASEPPHDARVWSAPTLPSDGDVKTACASAAFSALEWLGLGAAPSTADRTPRVLPEYSPRTYASCALVAAGSVAVCVAATERASEPAAER